ncbi:Cenp-O kinetochore centromere component-domain-containing protein [Macrophomina phaseolina]|uniref:Cenp-O kinetochore centromere component-domain-containing protein n=1 Tax=Macrophomina phaseolina TaxID=35725 RepID=A0ABQ8GLL2_9PEZI|nr:Cenp-O kinetochore centromere component-domain-containing protein [Macrophomina phaseolina]
MAESPVRDSPLDSEIALMREQIESLERQRTVLSSTLLASQNTLTRIQRANAKSNSANAPASAALIVAKKQQRHNLENLHRTCAGITAFRVKDPDPYAVDNGKILGVRIEVSVKGKFAAPYYLLLNRPFPESGNLRIHKHTVPPCIPLQVLAAKYLPQNGPPARDGSEQQNQPQDLHRLVRELRQELVSHHLRLDAAAKMRKDAGLLGDVNDGKGKQKRGKAGITSVKALDMAAREIEIRQTDSSTARIVLSKRGSIEKVVARSGNGSIRTKAIERKIKGGDGRVEGVIGRLMASPEPV